MNIYNILFLLILGGVLLTIFYVVNKKYKEQIDKITKSLFDLYIFSFVLLILIVPYIEEVNAIVLAVTVFPFVEKIVENKTSLFKDKEWKLFYSFIVLCVLILFFAIIPVFEGLRWFLEFLVIHINKNININNCNIIDDLLERTIYLISAYSIPIAMSDKKEGSENVEIKKKNKKDIVLSKMLKTLIFLMLFSIVIYTEISKY